MHGTSMVHRLLVILMTLLLSACALMPASDPLQFTVADIESLPGEGMEIRMLVKLRIQNPNDAPIEYDGVYLRLDVLNKPFASGVSDARGQIPRYSETIVAVPVTISPLNVASGALSVFTSGNAVDKLRYRMEGKLNSPGIGSTRFRVDGELAPPPLIP
jgi:LEA14-like dessication related protein